MAKVADALQAQLKNIERDTGRKIAQWSAIIQRSGLAKHTDVVAMLKRDHGLSHGAAHRLSIVSRNGVPGQQAAGDPGDPLDALVHATREPLRPIVVQLVARVRSLGDVELAPKKGYVSLRRRKQFAMIQPGAQLVSLGLVLPGQATTDRLESAAKFNALFTHRLRIRDEKEVDAAVGRWLRAAFEGAG
jgi:hypothetical protein